MSSVTRHVRVTGTRLFGGGIAHSGWNRVAPRASRWWLKSNSYVTEPEGVHINYEGGRLCVRRSGRIAVGCCGKCRIRIVIGRWIGGTGGTGGMLSGKRWNVVVVFFWVVLLVQRYAVLDRWRREVRTALVGRAARDVAQAVVQRSD